jgi:N-methylhydantoinase A
MSMTVGVDVGGTFTDVVTFDGASIAGRKVPTTTPQDRGVVVGLEGSSSPNAIFLHGTTVATNQLIEEDGARVAVVTSEGFEDVLEIGRQARPSLYDPMDDRPQALAPRELRVAYSGDQDSVLDDPRLAGAEAIAVALVRSYSDQAAERAIGAGLRERGSVPVSVGAEVSPSFREYERVATTVLNAYLTPTVAGYLSTLDSALPMRSKLVMTSAGGLIPFPTAAGLAGRLVLSGPAAGVVAASELGRSKGHDSVISFDMGGTSTDVSRIEASALTVAEHKVVGRVNRVPSLAVRTIGAGGGSVAWADAGGALRVGPRSAGADPGPACYGMGGTEPTVTDANVVLGSIPSDLLLGGDLELDADRARAAVAALGDRLGLTVEKTASGIIEVVDNHMERALRSVSVEEGADPRSSVLVAFGGAGGLHASRLARSLGMPRVLIPPLSGVFSALGLLLARPRYDLSRTVLLAEGSEGLAGTVARLTSEAGDGYRRDHDEEAGAESVIAETRYVGQAHELAVPLVGGWPQLRADFEKNHLARFGFVRPDQPIELINLGVEISGNPPLSWDDLPGLGGIGRPESSRTRMLVDGVSTEVDIWIRDTLPPGFSCRGPGLVVEKDSAVLIEPGDVLSVHDDGALEIAQ